MQETLQLDRKEVVCPEINTAMLNTSSQFLRKINDFNSEYSMDIGVQNSARWEAGSYKKFKELALKLFNPDLDKAKKIERIFEAHTYSLSHAKDKLRRLNDELKEYRDQGIKFNDSTDTEGRDRLNVLLDNLNKSINKHDDIIVSIDKVPWFKKYPSTAKYSHPIITRQGHLEGYKNDYVKLSVEDISDTDNPMLIYLNVAFLLKDLKVKITNRTANDELLYEYEYGNLVVCQTISLFDAISVSRIIQNNSRARMALENKFSGTTIKYPLYSGLQHPFVSSSSEVTRAYGTGNTCFGDLTDNILALICQGELSLAKVLLYRWATTYPKNNVSPLNRYYTSMFGKPFQIKNADDAWQVNSDICKQQVREYPEEISKQDFMETFCSNCSIIQQCPVNKEFSYVEKVLTADEISILDNFSHDIYKKDVRIRTDYVNEEDFHLMMRGLYVYFARKYKMFSSPVRVMLNKFNVRRYGNGCFHNNKTWDAFLASQEPFEELTAENFILWYKECEGIYYSNIAINLGLDVSTLTPSMTDEEKEDVITNIRSTHIANQRAQAPTHALVTFASLLAT